ncbi:hypothetical protein OIU85_023097 [Salix viminalis]|uniref:Uncharacterized protein n=1 Tax=Salix viminalis TaxID=40686 RepID=A0A9Q0U875_SALVM|nr:hypothetical protein OIU85_023097 [Salix viminalis]
MDAPTPVPTEALVMNANSEEVDLFADAAFVSAPPQAGKEGSSQTQTKLHNPGSRLQNLILQILMSMTHLLQLQ